MLRPGVGGRVAEVLGDPVDRDPAGDPLAERDPQLVRRLVDVLADLALHRHRDQVLAVQPVDADVVVVDQLAQLGGDRHADLGHAGEPVEAGAELLDRLELRRPGRHPVEVLGRPDRDAGLGRQLGHRLQLGVRPRMRPVVIDVEQPQEGRAVPERRVHSVSKPSWTTAARRRAARVVAIADREEGRSASHRGCRKRPRRHGRRRPGGSAGQPATDLGDDRPVAALQEDRGAIAFEQDHRVVDQAGQDPIEIEPAADVAGDPPERLGAVAQMADLGASLRRSKDGAENLSAKAFRHASRVWAP